MTVSGTPRAIGVLNHPGFGRDSSLGSGTSPRSTVSDVTSPVRKNLREEIGLLLDVARFHAGPLPAEFAANHPAELT